jgi:hypothetical protein
LLVLSHVLLFGGTEAEILAGIRRGGYRGEVVIAKDLQRF